jgi:hypothetical protein
MLWGPIACNTSGRAARAAVQNNIGTYTPEAGRQLHQKNRLAPSYFITKVECCAEEWRRAETIGSATRVAAHHERPCKTKLERTLLRQVASCTRKSFDAKVYGGAF